MAFGRLKLNTGKLRYARWKPGWGRQAGRTCHDTGRRGARAGCAKATLHEFGQGLWVCPESKGFDGGEVAILPRG
jgi:hypothetical protein